MAITLADFNKIWASTSPLTPYSFSDSQYKEGWNFIGSTPPSRQMWDFLQKNNDEKMQYLLNHFDNYLPLSGGTLTDKIWFDSSEGGISIASSQNEAGRLRLTGGSGYNKGAQLLLNGQSVSSNPGHFQLSATDTTNTVSLYGFPDGRLTWAGKTVIVGTEATETFSIKSINAGAQKSFSLEHTPRYYNVSLSGTGFANMLVTKDVSNTFYVVNTDSQNRTNITVTVNYIY